jgi:hypothetical protein
MSAKWRRGAIVVVDIDMPGADRVVDRLAV